MRALARLGTAGRFIIQANFRNHFQGRYATQCHCLVPDGYIIAAIRDNTNIVRQRLQKPATTFSKSTSRAKYFRDISPRWRVASRKAQDYRHQRRRLLVFTGQRVEVYVNPDTGQMRWHNYDFKLDSSRRKNGVLVGIPASHFSQQPASSAVELPGQQRVCRGRQPGGAPPKTGFGVLAKISASIAFCFGKRYYQHRRRVPRHTTSTT